MGIRKSKHIPLCNSLYTYLPDRINQSFDIRIKFWSIRGIRSFKPFFFQNLQHYTEQHDTSNYNIDQMLIFSNLLNMTYDRNCMQIKPVFILSWIRYRPMAMLFFDNLLGWWNVFWTIRASEHGTELSVIKRIPFLKVSLQWYLDSSIFSPPPKKTPLNLTVNISS